jgi:hypothetical protein
MRRRKLDERAFLLRHVIIHAELDQLFLIESGEGKLAPGETPS